MEAAYKNRASRFEFHNTRTVPLQLTRRRNPHVT